MPYKDLEKKKQYMKEYHSRHPDRWKKRDPEQYRESMRKWQKKNRERCQEACRTDYQKHKKRYKRKHKEYNRRLKMKVLVAYGGNPPKCACCGESHIEFLCIDHIHGGGAEHVKKLARNGIKLYTWLVKNNFPEGFRVLCYNCNRSLGIFNYCPHHTEDNKRIQWGDYIGNK